MKIIYKDGHVDECPQDQELHVIRHTAAHIMAQAIKRLYPQADFAFGPATENGFYYDVDLGDQKLSDEDLANIEKEMRKIVKENLPIKPFILPRAEAVSIALHIVNAELEGSDLSSTLTAVEVLDEVTTSVEQELGIVLNRESYNYARFAMHIQFLVRRLSAGVAMEQGSGKMLDELSREYPAVYHCACTVAQDIEQHHGWHCSCDEVLYLMLHIYRVQNCESN